MTLRTKTLLLIGATLIVLILALYITLRVILLNGFAALEEQEIRAELNSVRTFLDAELSTMHAYLEDWASWDDTFDFVERYDEGYIEENIDQQTFVSLRINAMLFLDRSHQLVYAAGMETNGEMMPTPGLAAYYDAVMDFLEIENTQSFWGYISLSDQVIMLAARPIYDNLSHGEANGLLVWARILDETKLIRYVEAMTHTFYLDVIDSSQATDEQRHALNALMSGSRSFVSVMGDEQIAAGYALLSDLHGRPTILLSVEIERAMFQEARTSISYYLVALLLVGLFLTLTALCILEFIILSPLMNLSVQVRQIGKTRDFSARLPVSGRDELTHLAAGINVMLDAVEGSSNALKQLNAELETRVSERTLEIEVKNRELAQMQANKDEFFARASHELRTPLTNIITRLYLLERQPEQLAAHLRVLKNVSNTMRELINELLEISRLQRGAITLSKQRIQVQTLVNDVIEMQRQEADASEITLRADMSSTPIYISGDPKRLAQIMTNLVINAIHYTSNGGEIVVSVHADDKAVIQVRDNGLGIAPEHLLRLFEPFFRAHEEISLGTGLGLLIVKELVLLHGGEVSVSSEVNVGSTFTVKLPLVEAAAPALASVNG